MAPGSAGNVTEFVTSFKDAVHWGRGLHIRQALVSYWTATTAVAGHVRVRVMPHEAVAHCWCPRLTADRSLAVKRRGRVLSFGMDGAGRWSLICRELAEKLGEQDRAAVVGARGADLAPARDRYRTKRYHSESSLS